MRGRSLDLARALLGASLLAGPALAQERQFTLSRDWHVRERGAHAFELRTFFDTTHGDSRGQLRYEYGLTPHLALGPGIEVREDAEGDYEVGSADLELRLNLGKFRKGRWLPALSVAYEHPFEDEELDRLELKSVLARYGERDDLTLNLSYDRELEGTRAEETELTAGWLRHLGGVRNRRIPAPFGLGLEAVQDFEQHHLRAGPLLVWRAGAHLSLLASYLPAIDERDEDNFDLLTVIVDWRP